MATIVFMGTPDFAVPALRALIADARYDVVGVVTQPDRPAGRNRQVQMSPVKQVAVEAGIPVFQPERLRDADAIAYLRQWSPDVFVVAAFGQILPQAVLDIPPHGSINIHASLLPRWRGAAPINAAIQAGDAESGITIMKMDEGLDTGAMLSRAAVTLAPDETATTLHDTLAQLGADLLIETLPRYLAGEIAPEAQNESLMTFAPRIDKQAGRIDWSASAAHIERTVRAFTPWPGTFTRWNNKQLKIHRGAVGTGDLAAGVVAVRDGRVAIGTGDGVFYPLHVQLEGKGAVSIDDFMRGYPAFEGAVLD